MQASASLPPYDYRLAYRSIVHFSHPLFVFARHWSTTCNLQILFSFSIVTFVRFFFPRLNIPLTPPFFLSFVSLDSLNYLILCNSVRRNGIQPAFPFSCPPSTSASALPINEQFVSLREAIFFRSSCFSSFPFFFSPRLVPAPLLFEHNLVRNTWSTARDSPIFIADPIPYPANHILSF